MALTLTQMAALHRLCFTTPRPWSEAELAQLVHAPGVIDLRKNNGFLLGRVIADEAELLTLAVHPSARRSGEGRALVSDFLHACRDAASVFLEVAADNDPAIQLYRGFGFEQAGLRKAYYGKTDAIVMSRKI